MAASAKRRRVFAVKQDTGRGDLRSGKALPKVVFAVVTRRLGCGVSLRPMVDGVAQFLAYGDGFPSAGGDHGSEQFRGTTTREEQGFGVEEDDVRAVTQTSAHAVWVADAWMGHNVDVGGLGPRHVSLGAFGE